MTEEVRRIQGKKSDWPELSSEILNAKRYRINIYKDLKEKNEKTFNYTVEFFKERLTIRMLDLLYVIFSVIIGLCSIL